MKRAKGISARADSGPLLCYVTDRHSLSDSSSLIQQVTRAVDAGIDWIQIREKDLLARELNKMANEAVEVAGKSSEKYSHIFVNDRLDVAIAAHARGVHLGETSLPGAAVHAWREESGADFLIGASCHSEESALSAEPDGADYIFFGPVFATPSKARFGAPQGTERLAEVASKVGIPVLAIGGITLENARECVAAGAAGIAAIRMFQEAQDLPALVTRLRSRFSKA